MESVTTARAVKISTKIAITAFGSRRPKTIAALIAIAVVTAATLKFDAHVAKIAIKSSR